MAIRPTEAYYIKLGAGGKRERDCILKDHMLRPYPPLAAAGPALYRPIWFIASTQPHARGD